MAAAGSVEVAGMGVKYVFPGMFAGSKPVYMKFAKDGSGVIGAKVMPGHRHENVKAAYALGTDPTWLAVDYSGASGALLLVAMTGPQIGHTTAYWLNVEKAKVQDVTSKETGAGTKTTMIVLGEEEEPAIDLDDLEAELAGGKAPSAAKKSAGKGVFYVMTLQEGPAPDVEVKGDKIVVGNQTIRFDGKKLILGKMAGPWKGP